MSSELPKRKKKSRTAAERRRDRCDGGVLYREVAILEERLFREQPELYRLLANKTLEELVELSLKKM